MSIITNINSQFPSNPYPSDGGSSTNPFSIQGSVDLYADLPDATSKDGQLWFVRSPRLLAINARGIYFATSGTWENSNIKIKLSEDSGSVINWTVWSDWLDIAEDIAIGDKVIFNSIEYRNLTGTQTTTSPNLDITNWGFPKLKATEFDISGVNPAWQEGLSFYDKEKHAQSYYNENDDMIVNLGQEVLFPVVNNSGATINNGDVITPISTGIALADRHIKLKSRLIAVATTTMLDGESGYATRLGQVGGLDTSLYSPGQLLYLGNDGEYAIAPPLDGSYTVIVGIVDVVSATEGIITVDINVSDLTVEVTDTNGFPIDQRAGTVITVLEASRDFFIAPTGTDFHFYERGDKYEKYASDTIKWSDLEGDHWFWYEDGILSYEFNPTFIKKKSIIVNNAFVSAFYWDATNKKVIGDMQDERHGISMSPETHLYLHLTRGAQWISGYSLGDFDIDGDGDLDSSAQFSVSEGVFFDEDLEHIESGIALGGTIPVIYNLGVAGDIRQDTNTGFAVLSNPAGRLYYNEWTGTTWQLTEVANRDACCYHIFGFNGQTIKTISVMGQVEYTSVNNARDGASTEISNIISQLPFPEMIPVATIVLETRDTYDNTVSARIRSIDGANYIPWTSTELSQGSAPASHSNLTNVQTAGIGVTQGHINSLEPLQLPTLTTVERDVFIPVNGMMIYNSTTNVFNFYENGAWVTK